jgi:phosphoribosyl-AMP cyclohydrolase
VEAEPDCQSEPIQSSKRLKRNEEDSTVPLLVEHHSETSKARTSVHYQDTAVSKRNTSYCSFVSPNKKQTEPAQLNPVQQILDEVATDCDPDDEDEQKKKIAAAKKLLFPGALATSFSEVSDTLRNERRQEFCPIYQDETPEQVALRLAKRKPIGSLLSKRIRWDDLKRKREEEEKKAQMQFRYGFCGPAYDNQSSFANPYEQYYAAVQNQYDLVCSFSKLSFSSSLPFVLDG